VPQVLQREAGQRQLQAAQPRHGLESFAHFAGHHQLSRLTGQARELVGIAAGNRFHFMVYPQTGEQEALRGEPREREAGGAGPFRKLGIVHPRGDVLQPGIEKRIGVRALLVQVWWLYLGFKIVGGFYLLSLAFRLWRGAREPVPIPDAGREPGLANTRGVARTFVLALAAQLSNPKAVVVIGGIFAALLPNQVPAWMYVAIPPIVMTTETSWYALVAVAVSSKGPRAAYVRSKLWIDRAAGTVLGVLAGRLLIDAASTG